MAYKHCCVIGSDNHYKTLVLVRQEPNESGQVQDVIQHYTLQDGETIIDTSPPTYRPYAGAVGLVNPRWDGSVWAEAATAAEIAAWEAEHPAPAPPGPSTVDVLGAQVAQLTLTGMQKDQVIDALGTQLVQTRLDVMLLKSQLEGGE